MLTIRDRIFKENIYDIIEKEMKIKKQQLNNYYLKNVEVEEINGITISEFIDLITFDENYGIYKTDSRGDKILTEYNKMNEFKKKAVSCWSIYIKSILLNIKVKCIKDYEYIINKKDWLGNDQETKITIKKGEYIDFEREDIIDMLKFIIRKFTDLDDLDDYFKEEIGKNAVESFALKNNSIILSFEQFKNNLIEINKRKVFCPMYIEYKPQLLNSFIEFLKTHYRSTSLINKIEEKLSNFKIYDTDGLDPAKNSNQKVKMQWTMGGKGRYKMTTKKSKIKRKTKRQKKTKRNNTQRK